MLLAALTTVCGSMFAQEETTVTWEASSGDALTTIYPDANISLKWEDGGGDFGAKYVNGSVYFYNGNRVTVAGVTSDVTIKKIVFTFSGDRYSMVTCNAKGQNESSTGITNSSTDLTSTWEGEANSLIFRAPKQTKERYISSIAVTYTGGTTGPVVTAPKLNITTTNWNDTYDMDTNGVFVVYAKNEGNAAAENAKVTVYVDGAENTAWEVGTLAIGADNVWKNMKYNLEGIEAGKHQVKLALTAGNADAFEVEKEVTFTKATAEATFSIVANNVTVPYDATNFTVVAQLSNSSEIAGANVKVELRDGIATVAASQTVETLAASASTEVRLTVEGGPFDAGKKTYYLYVNDKYLNPVEVTFEEAPVEDVYDLAITSISGTIEQDNETNNVRVIVMNNGNVDITDAPITLTAGELTLNSTVSAIKNQTGWVDFAVPTAGFEPGEVDFTATVEVEGDATPADNTMTQKLTVVAATAPEATFTVTAENVTVPYDATNFTVVALLTNTSEIAGINVKVELRDGITTVAASQTVETLAASASTEVRLTVEGGSFDAGKKTYYLYVNDKYLNPVEVTFEEQPVEQVIDINLTAIQGISEINLKETNTVQVLFDNNSTVDELNATITLSLNGTEVETKAITKNLNFLSFTLPTEGLTADEEATIVATLNVENNKEGNTASLEQKLNVVSGEAAPAPVIIVNPVSNQEVEAAGEQEITVSVGIFNNGNADAEGVVVKVYQQYGTDLDNATVNVAKDGGSAIATLKFNYDIQQATTFHVAVYYNNVLTTDVQDFTVTVKAADEEKKVDMALIAIQGISEIDLNAENNNITVWYENKGNVTVASATITAKMGETDLEAQTVENIKPKSIGYVTFTLPTTSLTTGETVKVVATIAATGDEVAENNTFEKEYEVTDATSTEAEFELTAQDVEVELAAETITVTVNVKNVGSQAGSDIEVNLFYNGVIAAQTIETLFPDGEQALTFTFDNIFKQAGTYTVYAMTADRKYISTFNVTVKPETVEQKVDLAVMAIHGSLSLDVENNSLTVFVDNLGTVDMTNVPVRLTIGNGVYTGTIASVKAGTENNFCSFTIPAANLQAGEVTVTATVTAENDVDENNNTLEKNYTIAAPQAELSFTVEAKAVANAEAFDVVVTVTNSEKADAENIVVTVYDEKGTMVGTATINQLAAGVTENVAISVEKVYAEGGTYKNQFQVVVSGVEGVKWVDVVVDATITAIQAVQAQYGKNVQIYTLDGKKVNNVRKGVVYIINGKKMMMK